MAHYHSIGPGEVAAGPMGHPERQPNGVMVVGHADPDVERSQKNTPTRPQPNQPSAAIFSRQTPAMAALFYCQRGRYLRVNKAGASLLGVEPEAHDWSSIL